MSDNVYRRTHSVEGARTGKSVYRVVKEERSVFWDVPISVDQKYQNVKRKQWLLKEEIK